jgi:hypothetical protein
MRIAGSIYMVAAIAFMAVFGFLAAQLGYPDLLDRPAAEVLPALLASGSAGRAAWAIYAMLPLLLLPAATLAAPALAPRNRRDGALVPLITGLQWVAGLSMMVGLLRWSTVQWLLAEGWERGDANGRTLRALHFDLFNRFLGNGIGEFIGELALYGSFVLLGVAMRRASWPRFVTVLAWVTGVMGLVGMFRNITPAVQWSADIVNGLLPLFLIIFGISLWRRSTESVP